MGLGTKVTARKLFEIFTATDPRRRALKMPEKRAIIRVLPF
jgi:hypothetical protein